MTLDDALTELNVIKSRLDGVLEDEGRRAVENAIHELQGQRPKTKVGSRPKKKPLPAWKLRIPPGNPLTFIQTEISQDLRHRYAIDIACMIDEPKGGMIVGQHNIAVRVWTADPALYFRDTFDAQRIHLDVRNGVGKRVMMRFHFDHAEKSQPGPKYHLQIGGIQHGAELCWLPESMRVPRFCHHPLSLLMVCEFVVRTFYPATYRGVCTEPTWIGALAKAQDTYLPAYYGLQAATRSATAGSASLLTRLWNVA